MADSKGAEGRPFLSRWSERKRQAGEAVRQEQDESSAGRGEPVEGARAAGVEVEPVDPATLPDIDSLAADSDFTVFMQAGVPEALKQRALRRLWQVDPAFNVICPLDDYNLDYTDAATVVPNLKTLYQVGRGMVLPEAEPEKTSGVDHAEALPSGASESAPASLPSPDVAGEPEQAAEQEAPAVEQQAAQTCAVESVSVAENRPSEVSPRAGQEPRRSARRRRWGDDDR